MSASPLKPWERAHRNNEDTTPSISANNNVDTSSSYSNPIPNTSPIMNNPTGYRPQSRYGSYSPYSSSYGSYSPYSSSYSSYSPYGSSPYSSYGSPYGMGMGGYGMNRSGGYGAPGPYGPQGPHQGSGFMNSVESSVQSVGRFSELLHMNLDSMHMSFSSLLQLLTNVTMLRQELGAVSEFIGVGFIVRLIRKLQYFVKTLLHSLTGTSESALEHVYKKQSKNQKKGKPTPWGALFIVFAISLWILRKIVEKIVSYNGGMHSSRYINQNPLPDVDGIKYYNNQGGFDDVNYGEF